MAFGSTPLGDRLSDGDAGVLAQMFAPLAEAVIVRDLDAKLVFANQAALSLLGAEQFSELQQRADELIMADLIIDDEQGQRLSAAELLTQPATNGETVRPILIRIVHRDTGKTTWNLLKVTALRDAAGEMAGTITVLEDRTALKVGEIRTQVLAESGRILASSLDFEQTLRNVADIAVPSLADYCGVDILDDSGRLARVAARLDGPGTEQLQARLRDLE
ncbi:MAG: PAS domain-containing protein, partial [Solirubrobacterales bacterium]|nr:PAS domain-containing protein [Solirubrobacterales bacterium]